jgi:hypothetical protein
MTKKRIRVLGGAFVALLALTAVVASSASAGAPRWKVAGAFLANGATKSATADSTSPFYLNTPGLGVLLQAPKGKCTTTGTIVGSAALSPGTAKEGKLTCSEVTVHEAPLCSVKSTGQVAGTVVASGLKGTLVWLSKANNQAGLKFEPSTGPTGEFTTVILSGAECALAGNYVIKGEVTGEFLPIEKEVETGELNFPKVVSTAKEATEKCVLSARILKHFNNTTPTTSRTETSLGVPLTFKGQPTVICGSSSAHLNPKQNVGVFIG